MPRCTCQCGHVTNSKGMTSHWKENPHHSTDRWLSKHPRLRKKAERLRATGKTNKAKTCQNNDVIELTADQRHRIEEMYNKIRKVQQEGLNLDDNALDFVYRLLGNIVRGYWNMMSKAQKRMLHALHSKAEMFESMCQDGADEEDIPF